MTTPIIDTDFVNFTVSDYSPRGEERKVHNPVPRTYKSSSSSSSSAANQVTAIELPSRVDDSAFNNNFSLNLNFDRDLYREATDQTIFSNPDLFWNENRMNTLDVLTPSSVLSSSDSDRFSISSMSGHPDDHGVRMFVDTIQEEVRQQLSALPAIWTPRSLAQQNWIKIAQIVARISASFSTSPVPFQAVYEHCKSLNLETAPSWNLLQSWLVHNFDSSLPDDSTGRSEVCVLFEDDFIPNEILDSFPSYDSLTPLQRYYFTFCIISTLAAADPDVAPDPWSTQLLMCNLLWADDALRSHSMFILHTSSVVPDMGRELFVGGLFRASLISSFHSILNDPDAHSFLFTRLSDVLSFLFSVCGAGGSADWVAFFEQVENLDHFRHVLYQETSGIVFIEPFRNLYCQFLSLLHSGSIDPQFALQPCEGIFHTFSHVGVDHVMVRYFGRPRDVKISMANLELSDLWYRFQNHQVSVVDSMLQ